MDYVDVASAIVDEEKSTIGQVALGRLKTLDFVSVEDDEANFDDDISGEEIEALLDVFRELQGKGAVGMARRSLEGELSADDDLDLPEEIIPEDIKADNFVKGI